jgi:hypothetical protein
VPPVEEGHALLLKLVLVSPLLLCKRFHGQASHGSSMSCSPSVGLRLLGTAPCLALFLAAVWQQPALLGSPAAVGLGAWQISLKFGFRTEQKD